MQIVRTATANPTMPPKSPWGQPIYSPRGVRFQGNFLRDNGHTFGGDDNSAGENSHLVPTQLVLSALGFLSLGLFAYLKGAWNRRSSESPRTVTAKKPLLPQTESRSDDCPCPQYHLSNYFPQVFQHGLAASLIPRPAESTNYSSFQIPSRVPSEVLSPGILSPIPSPRPDAEEQPPTQSTLDDQARNLTSQDRQEPIPPEAALPPSIPSSQNTSSATLDRQAPRELDERSGLSRRNTSNATLVELPSGLSSQNSSSTTLAHEVPRAQEERSGFNRQNTSASLSSWFSVRSQDVQSPDIV